MRTKLFHRSHPLLTTALALLALAGCETYDPGNPLIGRWTLIAPIGLGTADAEAGGMGMALGTYEFRRSSMRMRSLGFEQPVSYSVSGNTVTVLPESFGPTLAIELIDSDTARLKDPLTGGLMTLRRVR